MRLHQQAGVEVLETAYPCLVTTKVDIWGEVKEVMASCWCEQHHKSYHLGCKSLAST